MFRRSVLLSMCLAFAATNAFAIECTVDDPSCTPLNVCTQPNGPILGALDNDETVFVSDVIVDGRGRRWAEIVPADKGRSGQVFKAYLACEGWR